MALPAQPTHEGLDAGGQSTSGFGTGASATTSGSGIALGSLRLLRNLFRENDVFPFILDTYTPTAIGSQLVIFIKAIQLWGLCLWLPLQGRGGLTALVAAWVFVGAFAAGIALGSALYLRYRKERTINKTVARSLHFVFHTLLEIALVPALYSWSSVATLCASCVMIVLVSGGFVLLKSMVFPGRVSRTVVHKAWDMNEGSPFAAVEITLVVSIIVGVLAPAPCVCGFVQAALYAAMAVHSSLIIPFRRMTAHIIFTGLCAGFSGTAFLRRLGRVCNSQNDLSEAVLLELGTSYRSSITQQEKDEMGTAWQYLAQGNAAFMGDARLALSLAEGLIEEQNDLQLARYILRHSETVIPTWRIDLRLDLYVLLRLRRESEMKSEESTLMLVASCRKAHFRCLKHLHAFWSVLLRQNNSTEELPGIINKLEKAEQMARKLFLRATSGNKTSPQLLRLYAHFLKDVAQDYSLAAQVRQAAVAMEEELLPKCLSEAGDNLEDEFAGGSETNQATMRKQIEGAYKTKALVRFNLSFYLMCAIIVVMLIVMHVSLCMPHATKQLLMGLPPLRYSIAKSEIRERPTDYNVMSSAAMIRRLLVLSWTYTRQLNLAARGMIALNESQIRTEISGLADTIEASSHSLFLSADSSGATVRSAWLSENIETESYNGLTEQVKTNKENFWGIVETYVTMERTDATKHTATAILCVTIVLPAAVLVTVLLPALYSLNKERIQVNKLFLQIPKSSIAVLCKTLNLKMNKLASASESSEHQPIRASVEGFGHKSQKRHPFIMLALKFLLSYLVAALAIALLTSLLLNTNTEYMGRAFEINYAGVRWSYELRMKGIAFEALSNGTLWNRTQLFEVMAQCASDLSMIHESVKFGNKSMGLKGSVGRLREIDEMLFKPKCPDKTEDGCLSLDSLMFQFLSMFLGIDLERARNILIADAPHVLDDAFRNIDLVFGIMLPSLILLFPLVLQPAQTGLTKDLHMTRRMFSILPVTVVESTPAIANYVLHGFVKELSSEASKERSRHILRAAIDAVVEVDQNGQIETVNKSAEMVFGYNMADLVGQHVNLLSAGNTCMQDHITEMLRSKEKTEAITIAFDVECRRKDESLFPASCSLRKEELLSKEKQSYEALLLSVLPRHVANRIKNGETTIVDSVPMATMLFADIVNFTPWAAETNSADLIKSLNKLFGSWDQMILTKYREIEKIKTIGDCYMAATGIADGAKDMRGLRDSQRAVSMVSFALDMIGSLEQTNKELFGESGKKLSIRIGINSGPVTAGVVGSLQLKPNYDIFGMNVNVASRMESSGTANKIQLSRNTYELVFDSFDCEEHEKDVKGIGKMQTYIIRGAKAAQAVAISPHSTTGNK
eukprot:m51a1_g711 putative protein (1361) ;mRNA; r:409025-415192